MNKFDLVKNFDLQIKEIVKDLEKKFLSLRTSRPTSAIVEDIMIDSYGSRVPLKSIASINIILPNIITIEPWDKLVLETIKKTIEASSLGVSPVLDGLQIKIFLPPLSGERRQELCRLINEKKEENRIKIRKSREEFLTKVDNLLDLKEISKDEKFRLKEEIQKIVDKANKEIEELSELKNKEITTL